MKKIVILFFFFFSFCFSQNFKVASYNVENFFDLYYDTTEYQEYKPNTKYWNKKAFTKKQNNILQVIHDLNADILALQEIESQKAFDSLHKKTSFQYGVFIKKNSSAVGVGLLSKFPIINYKKIDVDRYDDYSRDILKATLKINNHTLIVYNNHWRSKRASESQRIKYALALKKDIEQLSNKQDYIILGDLNSNYNEYITFKYDKKLNDSFDITGINQILNSSQNGNLVSKQQLINKSVEDISHYNLWLELPFTERFSSKFKKQNNTPDSILISDELFDSTAISYIDNSFGVFKKEYLFKNNYINRWNKNKYQGYSDHLPVYAYFSTNSQNYNINTSKKEPITKVKQLYSIQKLNNFVVLKDIVVLYKTKKLAIVKQLNNSAIAVYKPPKRLKTGNKYTIKVHAVDSYFGLKEIKNITIINEEKYFDYKKLYQNGHQIDLFDIKNQNEMISFLKGTYKNGYLHYKDFNNKQKTIRIYCKKGVNKPKNDQRIVIVSGHLGIYRSNIQIIIYNNDNLKVL